MNKAWYRGDGRSTAVAYMRQGMQTAVFIGIVTLVCICMQII